MSHIQFIYLFLAGWLTVAPFANAQVAQEPTDISPLLIGEQIPNLEVRDINGNSVSLNAKVAEKPTILIFYRGGWCPFCNVQLAGFQEVQQEIRSLGYQVLAVSPESPERLKKASTEQQLTYELISDSNTRLMQAFGLAFEVPDKRKEQLADHSDGQNPGYLPVPAVFVLNTKGEILFEYINPNYRVRLDEDMLLAVLKTIKIE